MPKIDTTPTERLLVEATLTIGASRAARRAEIQRDAQREIDQLIEAQRSDWLSALNAICAAHGVEAPPAEVKVMIEDAASALVWGDDAADQVDAQAPPAPSSSTEE